jgi:hypothetical protein
MTTELSLKLKAFVAALMINAVLVGGTAYLFDGQLHSKGHFRTVAAQLMSSLVSSAKAGTPATR